MAIDTSKLVSAAMLQDFIIGKDAEPLAAGIITMYEDSNHTILKNWYYQTGVPGSYTWVALPNPMTLSAAGTMQDVNGNDIIPFYYPYDEDDSDIAQPYFVTVYNADGELQFTRSNFPFVATEISPVVNEIPTYDNLVINNRFWRNLNTLNAGTLNNSWTTQYNNTGTVYYQTLCPDQHDGFSMPDLNYVKNINGSSTETITFDTFAKQQTPVLTGDVQPEFYINHNCTADSSGASLKVYQFPISLHQATLTCQPFTFTIQGQVVSGSPTISIYIYAFNGTGVSSSAPSLLGDITLTTTWTKWDLTGTFPSTLGVTLGSDGTGGNDDAFYLQIAMPTGADAVCNLNFTLPSIYLSAEVDVPTNSFQTYDQIDSVVASSRTGDVKTSLNTFYPYGWVPLSGGTLAHPNTQSTTIVPPTGLAVAYQGYDGWALFNMVWTMFSSMTTASAQLVQIYDATGATTTYGASAYADWNALKQITLTNTMGRVVLGTVPIPAMTVAYSTTFTASSSSGLLLTAANSMGVFRGMPFTVSNSGGALPTGLSANTVYYVTADASFSATTFHASTTFANAMAGTAIAYTNSGTGTQTIYTATEGSYEGEYAHVQLQGELATHTHTGSVALGIGNQGTNPTGFNTSATTGPTGLTINNAGSSTAFNITQPGVFYNMFMKL
jgi:hypothetical protein